MIYNINDSYYINQAVDFWLSEEDNPNFTTEDEEVIFFEERCMSDD